MFTPFVISSPNHLTSIFRSYTSWNVRESLHKKFRSFGPFLEYQNTLSLTVRHLWPFLKILKGAGNTNTFSKRWSTVFWVRRSDLYEDILFFVTEILLFFLISDPMLDIKKVKNLKIVNISLLRINKNCQFVSKCGSLGFSCGNENIPKILIDSHCKTFELFALEKTWIFLSLLLGVNVLKSLLSNTSFGIHESSQTWLKNSYVWPFSSEIPPYLRRVYLWFPLFPTDKILTFPLFFKCFFLT